MIYDPLEEYKKRLRSLHSDNTNKFFEELVLRSRVDIEKNRETVKLYNDYKDNLKKLKRKLNWMRFFRVVMCITVILIPIVIWKMTPKIRALREDIAEASRKADELLASANDQMLPLNSLFSDRDALTLIEQTVPLISFDENYSIKRETEMKLNYDFVEQNAQEESTVELLSGSYNDNPFLFENKLIHRMGTETYHGSKTIHWTETYRDSDGKLRTRTRSETLHASVEKPKPFYSTQVVLNYGSQSAPELEFSRDASHLEQKSEREMEKFVKRGAKRLKKKTDRALRQNDDFVAMANSDFEVIFDALDRTNEVQFRSLFTPLAQTNMVKLILSKVGYGDDFNFIKSKRMNRIISNHSQGRVMRLRVKDYISYSFDIIKENFTRKNIDFFKAVYFDFAPLLAVPSYQERPVQSLEPLPDPAQLYSLKDSEVLANAVDKRYVVHPNTKTDAILKTEFVRSQGAVDETCVTAYSYDIEPRVDVVSVRGGDGNYHNVSVPWDEYIPLMIQNSFYVSNDEGADGRNVMARCNGLSIFNH